MSRHVTIHRKPERTTTRLLIGRSQEPGLYGDGMGTAVDAGAQEPVVVSYDILERTGVVRHAFSTRLGGVSRGVYASLNLSYTRGDKRAAVEENFERMAKVMEADVGDMTFSDQTHTVNIRTVTETDRGKGAVRERDYTDVDGLVTCAEGIVLTTFYADCVPLFFVDPARRAIGLAHSGWRGTAGRMGARMVERMAEEFNCKPQDLIVAVGPSICGECYEVGEDVAVSFKSTFREEQLADILAPGRSKTGRDGKYLLDLWKANEWILRDAGVPLENIALPDLCTCCNPQLFFSHRASGGERGSLAAFLALR